MANETEYRRPAGIEDSDFEVININIAQDINREEMEAEKGPTIGVEHIISSDQLDKGVTIPASNGGQNKDDRSK